VSLKYVSWKDRKLLIADLKKIYSANPAREAEMALKDFSRKWENQYTYEKSKKQRVFPTDESVFNLITSWR